MNELTGPRIRLRKATAHDADRFLEILRLPGVREWWHGYDRARVLAELTNRHPDAPVFAILTEGRVIGIVMYDEDNDPDYRHAGIDVTLDPAWHGRGLGAEAVRTVAAFLFRKGHHRLVIDPAAHNEKAILAYTAAGFRPVGVMRRYERGPDGTFHDGLLMEMLREDLD